MASENKADGQEIEVYVAGEAAPETKTSLGAGDSRIIATDITQTAAADQCRLIRIERPDGSEHVVGTCDENGNLAVAPRASTDTSAPHVFNVRAYGAVPDGRLVEGVSTVAADQTLTAAAAAFTATDVGRSIRVYAAADGADLVTTVAAYTSATSVELAVAAGATVDDVVAVLFQTDNKDAIQAAIDAIPASGGILYFPAADRAYVVATDLTIPARAQVQFAQGAVLMVAGATVTIEGRVLAHEAQHIFGGIGKRSGSMVRVAGSGAHPLPSVVGSAHLGVLALSIRVVTEGGRGAGEFEWSVDGGATRTLATIPGDGIFEVPGTGATVTFPDATHYVGDDFAWGCTGFLFTGLGRTSVVHSAWWGPPLDEERDDGLAIQAAWDCVPIFGSATVMFPPTPEGLQAPRLKRTLRLRRGHIIQGAAGTQSDNGTVLYCDPLITGIVVESIQTSDDGGAGVAAVLRDFALQSSITEIPSWADAPAMIAVGALVHTSSADCADGEDNPTPLHVPNAEPRYYLRCITAGAKSATEPRNPGPLNAKDALPPARGIGRDVTEVGGPTWRCCIHAGVYAKVKCFVERVRVQAFTNVGIVVQSDRDAVYPAGPCIANGGGATQCTVSQCGVGVLALGPDANNCVFSEVAATDSGYALYGSDPDAPAEDAIQGAVGLWDEAQAGARWLFCLAESTHNGRGVYTRSFTYSHGSMIVGLHEESSALPMHVAAGTYMGGITVGKFTPLSGATVFLQGNMKNFYMQATPTSLPGVTTNLQLPGDHDTTSPDNGVLAAGSSDIGGDTGPRWNVHYGANGLPGYWGLRWATEPPFLAWTAGALATFDGVTRVGPSLAWLPQGAFRGSAAGYPSWYEFDSGPGELVSTKSTYVRGGLRVPGDRYRTPDAVGTFGSAAERVVLRPNDGLPRFEAADYPGLVTLEAAQADPDDPVNAISWQSKQPGYRDRVFRAVGLRGTRTTAGPAQPDVSAYSIGDQFWDNDVQWKYIGDTPVLGSTVVGATLQCLADGAEADLADDYGRHLELPDDSSVALRVTILARKDDGTTARDVYEVVAATAAGAITLHDEQNLAATHRLADEGWAASFDDDGLSLKITCDPAADTVSFKARVDLVSVDDAAFP